VLLEVSDGAGGAQTVVLARARDGAPAFLRTAALLLAYRGAALLPAVERFLRALAAARPALDWPALVGWAAAREAPRPRPTGRRRSATRAGHPFTLGRPAEWARFVARGARGAAESARLRHRVVSIRHQETECLVSPDVYVQPLTFLRYPWHRRAARPEPPAAAYAPAGAAASGDRAPRPAARLYATDVDERDVILGGTGKLAAALDAAARSPWAELGLLSFTCTPTVIGDDRGAAERAWRAQTDRPLLTLQDGRDRPGEPLLSLLAGAFAEAGRARAAAPPGPPRGLALVGYPVDVLAPELGLLERLGVPVAARVLPDVHLPDAAPFLGARLQVADDRRWLRPLVDAVFARLPLPLLRLGPPLGAAATRAWCAAVAAGAGCAPALDAAWDDFAGPALAELAALRAAAADRRLGFVAAADELDALWSGALFQGTPVFDAVGELGFGVEVLVHAPPGAPAPVTPGRRRVERPAGPRDVRVGTFATPPELEAALRASRATAFYSELTYDWRLTTCGKAAFSFHDLAFGLDGARRNARLLLALTRPGLLARRAAHLGGRARWDALAAAVEGSAP
jgi:hypothetical protein